MLIRAVLDQELNLGNWRKMLCIASSEVAKHLSEVCFISAESLILLLGCFNKIESQLETILKLAAVAEGRPHLAKHGSDALSPVPSKTPQGSFLPEL